MIDGDEDCDEDTEEVVEIDDDEDCDADADEVLVELIVVVEVVVILRDLLLVLVELLVVVEVAVILRDLVAVTDGDGVT